MKWPERNVTSNVNAFSFKMVSSGNLLVRISGLTEWLAFVFNIPVSQRYIICCHKPHLFPIFGNKTRVQVQVTVVLQAVSWPGSPSDWNTVKHSSVQK